VTLLLSTLTLLKSTEKRLKRSKNFTLNGLSTLLIPRLLKNKLTKTPKKLSQRESLLRKNTLTLTPKWLKLRRRLMTSESLLRRLKKRLLITPR
jgi:hypothetical protein